MGTAEFIPVACTPPASLYAGLPDGVSVHRHTNGVHTIAYLAAGNPDDQLIILCHGWPELGRSFARVLPRLAAAGYYAVAPDMRGYGGTSRYAEAEAYALRHNVGDIVSLAKALGASESRPAYVLGHDHGGPIAWHTALHHPQLFCGVIGVCVPYLPPGNSRGVDRTLYPEDLYPDGQWDYAVAHVETPDIVRADFDRDIPRFVASLFRAGDAGFMPHPDAKLGNRNPKVPLTADYRRRGQWFIDEPPYAEPDPHVLDPHDYRALVDSLSIFGFGQVNGYYRNPADNAVYAADNPTSGRIVQPALFVHARHDVVCQTVEGEFAQPMRKMVNDLTETVLEAGHWVPQEDSEGLARVVVDWLDAQQARRQSNG